MPDPPLCITCGWPLHTGVFDDARHLILARGRYRAISPTRWRLLSFFRSHPGQVLPLERIYNHLYVDFDRDDPPSNNNIRVHICCLRRSLRGTPYGIFTRAQAGYLFDLRQPPVRK